MIFYCKSLLNSNWHKSKQLLQNIATTTVTSSDFTLLKRSFLIILYREALSKTVLDTFLDFLSQITAQLELTESEYHKNRDNDRHFEWL
jgi:hypothetical protein